MSTASTSRAAHAVFRDENCASWAISVGMHLLLFVLVALAVSRGPNVVARSLAPSIVEFETPPPASLPRPPPPSPSPLRAEAARSPAPDPLPRPRPRASAQRSTMRVEAAPRVLAAAPSNDSPPAESMHVGTNEGYQGGNVGAEAQEGIQEPAPAPEPPAPPPPPEPQPSGPVQLPENATAPLPDPNNPMPEYPASARAAGIQGLVIVRFVVGADGSVSQVQVLRGPPEFHDEVLRVVRTWRFTPAYFDGHPIAVFRIHRFPFRLSNM